MKQTIRSLLSCSAFIVTLAASSWAFAQDDESDGYENGAPGAPSEGAAAPGEESASQPNPAYLEQPAAADKWARWSQRYIDRPRTLPKGMIEVGGYLDLNRLSIDDGEGSSSTTITQLTGAASYGVSDQLEVRVTYGLTLDEFEAKGPFSVGAALGLKEGQLALAVAGDLVYNLLDEVGEIGVGARARYKVMPNLAIYTQRQLEVTVISDYELKPANLRLPVGVGFQLNDRLYLFGETQLAVLDLKDSETLALFADYIPLTAGAVFSLSPKLEVGGLLDTDLKNDAFDTMLIEAFARFYL